MNIDRIAENEAQLPQGPFGMGPERVVMVFEQIANAASPLSHSELATTLGIAKSTLSALLKSLQRIGYVEAVEKRYRPGPRLLALAQTLMPQTDQHRTIGKLLLPILKDLATSSGETVTLAVEIDRRGVTPGNILAIAHVESPKPIRFVPGIGELQPMFGTAAGRCIYAFSSRVPPEGQSVAEDLAAIRKLGYALTTSGSDLTVIAAPVLNADRRPIAAISVFGPSYRIGNPVKTIWPLLKAATQAAKKLLATNCTP